jgi:hypothetical protein
MPVTVWPLSPAIDPKRTLRGALAGVAAALVWAIQQPLDKAVFGCRYDDVELLGRALVQEDGFYAPGLVLHLSNGAAFGALYANLAPSLPLAPVLRGPAIALAEHLSLWPLTRLTDRLHPARERLPVLSGNRRAFAQAAWRHLLFGAVLGELERRLNAGPTDGPAEVPAEFSRNGRGRLRGIVTLSGSQPPEA